MQDNVFALEVLKQGTVDKSTVFPQQNPTICDQCQRLNFWSRNFAIRETLASLEEASKACDFHSLLLRVYLARRGESTFSETQAIEILRDGSTMMITGMDTPALSICRTAEATNSSGTHGGPPNYIQIGFPRLPEIESSTYYEILRQWINDCDNGHPGCSRRYGPRRIPTRLMDVGQGAIYPDTIRLCVIGDRTEEQRRGMQYIALSHPWGISPPNDHFCTTTANISERLSEGIQIQQLPNTFKHAVRVTRALGLQYLWIDSLCIIQGDDGDFAIEAKHMETVFSSAYCVIAASRARGTSSGFLAERPDRKFVRFEGVSTGHPFYVCEAIDNFQEDVIEGSLNKRGWVLQERALARRTIYFTEHQTYWECGEGIRCETLTKMKNDQAAFIGDANFPELATKSSKGAKIRLYESLYKQYSKLEFTKAYDRPIAIAGLEQRLVRAFKTNGGYGVFEGGFFGRSLLWQRDVNIEKNGLRQIDFPPRQQYLVPSWSWMAYEGAISFMDLPFDSVQWEQYDGEGKGIQWQWRAYGKSDTDTSTSLPSAWTNPSWHTGESNEVANLVMRARDFVDFGSMSEDSRIVYDCGHRPPSEREVKCVVIGKQKANGIKDGADNLENYVLVIAAKKNDSVGDNIYERIGVGSLPGNLLVQSGLGTKVRIF